MRRSGSWIGILCVAALLVGCKRQSAPEELPSGLPAGEEAAALAAAAAPEGEEFIAAGQIPAQPGDLPEIQQRGVLRILIATHEEAQLPRQGSPASVERELARAFGELIGVKTQFVIAGSWDALVPLLREGKGDVIASNLTITRSRAREVAFTRPVATVSEVLVGRKGGKELPRSLQALSGREVHVRRSSSFAETLAALPKKTVKGLKVVAAPEALDSETLAYQVGRGERPLTVVDSHQLESIQTYNDQVEGLLTLAEGRQIAWATRQESPKLRAALDAFLIQRSLTGHTREHFVGDLEAIQKRGALRVLSRNDPLSYFLYQGQPQGFDFTLAALVARELGVRLEMVVPPSRELLIPWLLEGRGDVIAASFAVTAQRQAQLAFSTPYLFVDEVLVLPAGRGGPRTLAELAGKKVHLPRSSSHWATLEALQKKFGPFELVPQPEEQEAEELIAAVGSGEIPLTVVDSHALELELRFRDDVVAGPKLELDRPASPEGAHAIAFGVRKENPRLLQFLNRFVKKHYRGLEYNVAKKRYFENRSQGAKGKFQRAETAGISPYDALFQRYAARYSLDWRLLAAQSFQESRYDPRAKSWVGARGLFQVMPATGKELGFDDLEDPEQGVHAGARYMHKLIGQFEPSLPFKQRVRFALAAYNAGYGHVTDARRLAAERGLDPDRWFGNVEKAMLLLEKPRYYRRARHGYVRGSEPVKYVSEIQNRYDNYVKILVAAPEP